MDANTIDIIGKRSDGGLDLVIVMDKMIDDSPEDQEILLDKIENYMGYVGGAEFKKEFPSVVKDNVNIKLIMPCQPSEGFVLWLKKIDSWVKDNGMNFVFATK
ncbi:DUF6572 domain-containing protein [Butyrivibrio sp. XBB1001]|uniref:DUF6572 domain-containing protein n=1 Tax=Butyrivibrio sp. XBB1001 TaxID=1280682 RepID=UPI00047D9D38|nr:DUF6572 domain-containing protein [Butyrivibrio sp. XBB1001]